MGRTGGIGWPVVISWVYVIAFFSLQTKCMNFRGHRYLEIYDFDVIDKSAPLKTPSLRELEAP